MSEECAMDPNELRDLVNYVAATTPKESAPADYNDLPTSLGQHRVLPYRRTLDPVSNFSLALELLFEQVHKAGYRFKIDQIEFGGFNDREAIITYTVAKPSDIKELVLKQDPAGYGFF